MDPFNLPKRTTPYWGMYQRELFKKGAQEGVMAPFNPDPAEAEKLAEKKLSEGGWYYASSNASSSWTHLANRQAFYRHRIIPRMLQPTLVRDTTTTLFGHTISAPIITAPIGINRIYHQLAELPVAKVAGELNIPYALSTAGSSSIEDVGKSNDEGRASQLGQEVSTLDKGIRFFQLYWPHDDELCESLLQRAFDSGFTACILTVDTPQLAWRYDDVNVGNYAFYKGIGAEMGLSDPVFLRRLKEQGIDPKTDIKTASERWIDQVWHGKPWTWDDLPTVIKRWKRISNGLPFLLKGVQSANDASLALTYGCDGIVVSNHAGRQVDGAVASLDALEEVAEVVKGKMTIIYDSGVRTGADVFKALALGADAVGIGRLWIWGLSIDGEVGVRHVLRSLLADFDLTLETAGYQSIKEIKELGRKCIKSLPQSANLIAEKSRL